MDGVFVVTVTYGNRFHLLRQVIEAAFDEGVDKVIVVDNNSEPESRKRLREYHRLNRDRVDVLYLSENLGSAGGFKRGLKRAYNDPECEFIWLLDDDNLPMPRSLKILKNFWKNFDLKNKKEKLALFSFREDRHDKENLIKTLTSKRPELNLPRKNSYGGFHIFEFPKYIKRIVFRKLDIKKEFKMPSFGQVPVATYGGLFFNKKLLDTIGYPKEEFYVYWDDTEWTYRITRKGGKIILLTESQIKEIEKSWHITQKGTGLSAFTPSNAFRIYYEARNGIYLFRKYFIDNKLMYYFNMFVFLLLVLIHNLIFSRDITGFKVLLMAIEDANKGKLGKNPLFQ